LTSKLPSISVGWKVCHSRINQWSMVTPKKIDLFHRVRAFAGNQPSIKEKYIMLSNKIRTRIETYDLFCWSYRYIPSKYRFLK
jgi:hypothetical protein